jgi:hypothetical protein
MRKTVTVYKWGLTAYPFVLLTLLYAKAGLLAGQIGHWPRPIADSPPYVPSEIYDRPYLDAIISALIGWQSETIWLAPLVTFPLLALIFLPQRERCLPLRHYVIRLFFGFVGYTGLFFEPLRVLEWWID